MTTRCVLSLLLASALLQSCQTSTTKDKLVEGNEYAKDGLLREAIDSYKHVLAKDPQSATTHRNIGMVYVKLRDYHRATQHLEKAVKSFDQDFDTNFYLAEAYRANEKFADAIYHYQTALKIKSDDPLALKSLAWSFFRIRYYSEALNTAKRLKKITPRDPQVTIILARTLHKLKNYKDALQELRQARTDLKNDERAYLLSVEGDILFALGNLQKAQKIYKTAVKILPLLSGALLGLGKCHLQQNQNRDAIPLIEQAARIRPALVESHYLLGKAYEEIDAAKSVRHYKHFQKHASADPEFLSLLGFVEKRIEALNAVAAVKQEKT